MELLQNKKKLILQQRPGLVLWATRGRGGRGEKEIWFLSLPWPTNSLQLRTALLWIIGNDLKYVGGQNVLTWQSHTKMLFLKALSWKSTLLMIVDHVPIVDFQDKGIFRVFHIPMVFQLMNLRPSDFLSENFVWKTRKAVSATKINELLEKCLHLPSFLWRANVCFCKTPMFSEPKASTEECLSSFALVNGEKIDVLWPWYGSWEGLKM